MTLFERNMDYEEKASVDMAVANDYECVCNILYSENTTNSFGWTPLMHAAYKGYTSVVEKLFSSGADVSVRNKFGGSVMTLAAASGSIAVVRALMEVHPKKLSESDFVSPLAVAALFGHLSVARFLIDHGFDPNSAIPVSGVTPLMLAVFENHFEVAKLLVDRGANITCVNFAGHSALDLAMLKGQLDIVSFFHEKIRKNTDFTSFLPIFNNDEAVVEAAKTGNLLRLRNLLSQNTSFSTKLQREKNEKAKASSEFCHHSDDMQMCLSQFFQNVSEKTRHMDAFCNNSASRCFGANDQKTFEHRENISGFVFTFPTNSCLDDESDCNVKNENSSKVNASTYLMSDDCSVSKFPKSSIYNLKEEDIPFLTKDQKKAVHSGKISWNEIYFDPVLEEGALRNKIESSPLSLACYNGHTEAARFLIASGANPNQERDGRTPLMLAAISSNIELAKLLFSAGADPLALSSKDNLSAFDIASLYGADTEIMRLLGLHTIPPSTIDSDQAYSSSNLNESDCIASPYSIFKKLRLTMTPKADENSWSKECDQNSLAERQKWRMAKSNRYNLLRNIDPRELFPTFTSNITHHENKLKSKSRQMHLSQDYPKSYIPFDTPFRVLYSDNISATVPPTFPCCYKLKLVEINQDKKGCYADSSAFKSIDEPLKNSVMILSACNEYCDQVLTTNMNQSENSIKTSQESGKRKPLRKMSSNIEKSKVGKSTIFFNIKSSEPKDIHLMETVKKRDEFSKFLKNINLGIYASLFKENEIEDIDIILSLREVDLEEMGVKCAVERTKILNNICTFKT